MDLDALERRIGHRFARRELLQAALTHRSSGEANNERLEFLGDGLLDFLVAEILFEQFPRQPEGDLTRLRADLVRQETLHAVADELGLGPVLALGEGELKSGGRRRPSILADAFEALLAAIYLDGGFAAARDFVRHCFSGRVSRLDPVRDGKDAKTRLQEILQAQRSPLPTYRILATDGEAHAQEFQVCCELERPRMTTTGRGRSRRIAEQAAAEAALRQLEGAA
jgi:ribonuclease-3